MVDAAKLVRENPVQPFDGGDTRWGVGYTLITAMGVSYPEVAEDGQSFTAHMPITPFVGQRMGRVAGGAYLIIAESTAGRASIQLLDEGYSAVGQSVTANHVNGTKCDSGMLYVRGRMLHHGRRTHVWHVEITDETGELVSVATVTNAIIKAAEV